MKKPISRFSNFKMFKGFRQFLENSDALSLAVGVVVGAAFKDLVTAVMNSFIYPLISAIFGHQHFSETLFFTLNGVEIHYGALISALLNFILIMFAVYYFFIVPVNKLASIANVDIEIATKGKKHETNLDDVAKLIKENNRLLASLQKEAN
ncbi:MAG: MscL family protein [Bifidobacteriaceae bacterium]|jgi:large conductance mechanosensitive channel|nr:MscL family protein [Bifidobacteriaceae bacterium]